MTIILDNFTVPENGRMEIKVNLSFDIQVTAQQAWRKVDTWLMNEVSIIMGADPPTLVVTGERAVWRVPAHISYPHVGHAGVVGLVDVDVATGEMLNNTPELKAEMERCAEKIGARQPPFKLREAPAEYIPKHIPPAPIAVLPADEESEAAAPEASG